VSLLEVEGLRIELPVQGKLLPVLSDITLSLAAGETLGLVGESGSGKSMTVRAIDRLLPTGARSHGAIRFEDRDVLKLDGGALRTYRARDVAMIFQDARAAINPVRTIGDYMTEAMRSLGVDSADASQRAITLLDQVGIPDGERRLRQRPYQLSGGLLQRVMIATAMATHPKLLLADEPTTSLDVTTQADVLATLNDLRREQNLAMIFISHDLELASAICDRTAVLYAGEVVELQSSRALHETPLHPYTVGLLGARPSIRSSAHRLKAIHGHPVSAFEAPAGCTFAPRCPHVIDKCVTARPPLIPLGAGQVRCVRAHELSANRMGQNARVGT
jgi:oligopeptide/dipeptide ABC transporter ATP-binding protein